MVDVELPEELLELVVGAAAAVAESVVAVGLAELLA
jgi:hypothetical protein